jgi:hypothetical protein
LVAARALADTLARGGSPHDYAVEWQRRWGGLLAAYDVFRRFSQTLTTTEIERLMDSGLLDEWSARSGLAQQFPRLEARAAGRLVALARVLGTRHELGRRLAGTALRMSAAGALYAVYPRAPDKLPAWSRLTARALGVTPDIG